MKYNKLKQKNNPKAEVFELKINCRIIKMPKKPMAKI
jgi:hypothetical protein